MYLGLSNQKFSKAGLSIFQQFIEGLKMFVLIPVLPANVGGSPGLIWIMSTPANIQRASGVSLNQHGLFEMFYLGFFMRSPSAVYVAG